MTLNSPGYYKEVSLRLSRILDTVGLGEDIRWKRINMWIQSEEMLSVLFSGACHYFGSQAEATATRGLESDLDYVVCMENIVIKDLESWTPDVAVFLILSDESTPPGYVKLQGVYGNRPWLIYYRQEEHLKLDRHGRSVLYNDHPFLKHDGADHHGPANRAALGTNTVDSVRAMRLYAWPDQASRWLARNRRYNWPSQETIGLILQTGALLVPVGHKLSGEKHLEWRISISYGEKLLVWLFNSTQYKCYILLKMINKSFIKPVVGDDVLSSYHCKTCIFYLMENTPAAMWQPDNLLLCVQLCLKLLYNWTENINCPNYFIPEENMFLGKIHGCVQGQLFGILSNLLRQEGRYLLQISCDDIGQKLKTTCQNPVMELQLQILDVTQLLKISVMFLIFNLLFTVEKFLRNDLIFEPRALDMIVSSHKPRCEINAILWKFYCSTTGSKLASESLSEETPNPQSLEIAQELLLWGASSDAASGKLKLAAFYLVQDNLMMSEYMLNKIHKHYSYKMSGPHNISQHTIQAILSGNLSTTQLLSQYITFPVFYHHSEIKCTPKAVIPEMFRSTRSHQGDPHENYLPKVVSVDPKVYLYFLEFLCHHRQSRRSHKKSALDCMIFVIRYDDLEFKDTALNLLAYCLMQEGSVMNAFSILCKSMKLTKQQNAAVWQIATHLSVAFKSHRFRQ